MKKLFSYFAAAVLLMAATAWAQEQPSGPSNPNSSDNTAAGNTSAPSDLEQLKAMVLAQQKQLEEQARQIQELKQQLEPRVVNATLSTSAAPRTIQPASDAATPPQETKPATSPLSFRIGAAEFTPGGFVDFENIFRTTNTGNIAATNFGNIPFSNTVQGHLTEFRSTGQYSRINLKTTAKFGKNDVTGYIEADFNGNDPANVFVTSNSHTFRLRLFWVDLKRGKWELLGGSTWGLQTPNRVGVSPNPADLSLCYQEDAGIGVGYNYTRAGEFRVAYHFNDHVVWAVAAQNPDQFTNAEDLFPLAFNAQLGPQFDAANQTTTPNLAPDILTKIAFDNDWHKRHFHFEVGGLETAVKATVLPTVSGATFHSITSVGGGYFGGVVAELWKDSQGRNLKFVASGMGGYGVGRYTGAALAPQAVVIPINATSATCLTTGAGCDARVAQVHAYDVVGGFEILPHPKAQFAILYGATYAQRDSFPDLSKPGTPFIGFGGPNSGNNNNRAIQQGTVDWTQTFWRNPQYGAVYLVMQGSYLTRAPWFVPAGAPKNAHLFMGFVSFRYALP